MMLQSFKQSMLGLAFIALLGMDMALAEVLKDLYQVDIPIMLNDSEVDPKSLSKQAFTALLSKIGGVDSLKKESIRKAIENPDRYVKQLSYHEGQDDQRIVKVSFNEVLVDRLLIDAGGSLVAKERPLTLLWLVFEDSEGLHLVSPDTDPAFLKAMEQGFKQRAMPFLYPLVDLRDSAAINAEAISARNFDTIREASTRYHPERIVLGALKHTAEGWETTWTLVPMQSSALPLEWAIQAPDQSSLFDKLVDRLASLPQPTTPVVQAAPRVIRRIALHVSGVTGADDYAGIMQYLENTPFISKVRIVHLGPDTVQLSFSSTLAQDKLLKALSKNPLWMPDFNAKPSLGELFFILRESE